MICEVASVEQWHSGCPCWLQIINCEAGGERSARQVRDWKKPCRSTLCMETRPEDPCTPLRVRFFQALISQPGACVLPLHPGHLPLHIFPEHSACPCILVILHEGSTQ